MALEVGSAFARLGFKTDDDGADRFERRLESARREARRPVVANLKADADTRGFQRYNAELDKSERHNRQAERAAKSHGSALGGLGKTAAFVAGPAAFYGLTMGVRSAFNAYKESERVGRQTNAVLKSTGGAAGVSAKEVNNLANAISRKTGIDDEAIQNGENLLLTFTNVRNEAGKGNDIFNQTTEVMTDMSAALGQDTKSSAIQLGKALNDPIKGVTALQRVGVSFTKDQKEQIKTLVESGKSMDAQKLILAELNKEFGGSAAAQATSSKRLGVTLGNLAETVGRFVSPALETVAKGIDKFVNGALEGTGAGGKFVAVMRGVGGVVKDVAGFIGRGFNVIRSAFGGGDRDATRLGNNLRTTFSGIVRTVRSVVSSVARQFRTLGDELEVIGRVAARIVDFMLAVFRRMLPGIRAVFQGLARVIRGVVEVIAGILTLDFGKIADGFKHILGGLVKVAGGMIRALTAPFRETMSRIGRAVSGGVNDVVGFLRRLPGRALDAVASLPGLLAGVGRRAVSSFAKALAGLPGAIAGAFKGGGQFFGNMGRGIADWLNAHTPFGDKVKVGPVSVRLPSLRHGGNVGPGHGGARAFIAGEGTLPEWVISKEGDRRQNVAWARDALEELTGRRVGLHRGGKGKKRAIKPILGDATNRGIKRSVGRGEAGIKNFERDIQRMERHYQQVDREYGLSTEEFLVEGDDGSVTVDESAVGARGRELGSLHNLRERIRDKYGAYTKAVGSAIERYQKAAGRLSRAIKAARGKARGKERGKYVDERQRYLTRIGELRDVASDLGLDLEDQRLDLLELDAEKAAVTGTKAPPAAAGETGAPVDVGGGGTDELGTIGTGGGDQAAAPASAPTPAEIAAAALAQFSAFQSARADLFGSFGGNYMTAGGRGLSAAELGAGARYFGGGSVGSGAGGAGAPQVTQIITFPTPPDDPHGWTAASLHELQAAL